MTESICDEEHKDDIHWRFGARRKKGERHTNPFDIVCEVRLEIVKVFRSLALDTLPILAVG